MNEVLSYGAPSILEAGDYRTDASVNFGIEAADTAADVLGNDNQSDNSDQPETKTGDKPAAFPRLDGEVGPLVAANADVVAPCRWMGGAEVTLSTAIINYYMMMTEENADQILSDIRDFLAGQVTEAEEHEGPESELETEEPGKTDDKPSKAETDGKKTATKDEKQKASGKTDKANPEISAAKEINQQSSQNAVKAEKSFETRSKVALTPVESHGDAVAEGPMRDPAGRIPAEDFVPAAKLNRGISSGPPTALSETRTQQPVLSVEYGISRPNELVIPAVEIEQAVEGTEPVADMPAEITEISGGFAELSTLDLKDGLVFMDMDGLKEPRGAEDETALPAIDYLESGDKQTYYAEEDSPINHAGDNALELAELSELSETAYINMAEYDLEPADEGLIYHPSDGLGISTEPEPASPETPAPISLDLEAVEVSLAQLTERINTSQPEIAEEANEILDRIIEIPLRHVAGGGEIVSDEQEELNELFTELFDKLDIDYTPELIESLARLTLTWHLVEEIQKLKKEEAPDKLPQDTGTHEIIKKLLAGLSAIKKAMTHASAIGKSALRLCALNLVTDKYLTSQVF